MANAREVALNTLIACQRQGAWSDGFLKKAIRDAGLDRRDAAFATRLCFGVQQNRMLLDWHLARFSKTPLEKLEIPVLCNLRIALYQIRMMDKVPESAAVNEAVKLTRKYVKNPGAAGMVNGILRAILREGEAVPVPESGDWREDLAIRYSHPRWLVDAFADRLGREETERLLEADNAQPPTMAQINTLRATPEEVQGSLAAQGVQSEGHPWLRDCLMLRGTGDLEHLDAYEKGLFYIQDAGSKLSVLAAAPKAGDCVLDCCAAPGGKSFAAAIAMGNRGAIRSCDIHPHKIRLIEGGRDRMGLDILSAQVQNAAQRCGEWEGKFDVVITDVPCSGLGIIRKKPDIRYKEEEPLKGLPEVQFSILNNCSAYVRPGGTLLYSTCTLLRRENEAVVERFLADHADFEVVPFELPGAGRAEGMLTLWPHIHGTDGFFIAKLRRKG